VKIRPESPLGKRERLDALALEGFMSAFIVPRLDNSCESAPFHRECWAAVTSEHQKVVIAAPRGHAKSTSITFLYTLAGCLFGEFSFPVIFSKTYAIAVEFLRSIQMELEDNDTLANMFGFSHFAKESENDKIFVFKNGYQFRIMATGMDQPVRGLKWGSRRPDMIMLDDIEDDEEVLNDERREKFMDKLMSAVIPAGSPKTRYRMVGTVLHRASALERLLKSPTWHALRYEACDENITPESILWPAMYDRPALLAIRQEFTDKGKLDKFNMEYRNRPTDRSVALFREEHLLSINESDWLLLEQNHWPVVVGADFAITEKQRRDYTVFVIATVGPDHMLYVTDVIRERLDSEGVVTTMFQVEESQRLRTNDLPVQWFEEDGMIRKALGYALDLVMIAKGVFLNLCPMNPGTTDKRARAMPIMARVAARRVKFDHNASWWPQLREELLDFPRGEHDDQVDALAWIGIGLSQAAAPDSEAEDQRLQREEDAWFARHATRHRQTDRNRITGYLTNVYIEKMPRLRGRQAERADDEESRLSAGSRYAVPRVQP
jgi:predicted phage terminase large subunit-like protein